MGTRIQITITPDVQFMRHDEIDAAMARTLRLLSGEADVPTRKLTLTIECKDEDADTIRGRIHAALSGRPVGIEAIVKTTCEEHVAIKAAPKVTPMDRYLGDLPGDGIESVTLSNDRQSVTLTSQTARNAAAMLNDAPVGSDAPPRR